MRNRLHRQSHVVMGAALHPWHVVGAVVPDSVQSANTSTKTIPCDHRSLTLTTIMRFLAPPTGARLVALEATACSTLAICSAVALSRVRRLNANDLVD